MRVPVLHTLSGRIIVGFAVLILTFGAISGLTVHNLGLLSREIRIMRVGYTELALISRDLSEKQTDLRQYLLRDLVGESTEARVRGRITRLRKARERLISDATDVLDKLDHLASVHRRHMNLTRLRLTRIRHEIVSLNGLYDQLIASPPLDRNVPPGTEPGPSQVAATKVLEKLQLREGLLQGKIVDLARTQRTAFEDRSKDLEDIGLQLRRYTLGLGAIAVLVGLLITIWGAVTLRPLRRLRDAAGKIARGDYAGRIDERGPAEVRDLAHEFNVMGRAVEERERELVRSERLVAVGKMAAMITHEVRNPLSSIGLNTELLEEELGHLPPERKEEALALCRAITTEVDRLTGITEEYLQFARLPKPKLARERVERIIGSLAEFERGDLGMRGVELSLEIDPDLPDVMVDEGQIRQSLLNLVRNAADAVEEVGGGTVAVHARRAGAEVEVRVIDEGTGISPELMPKLFDPFFSTKEGGTGLGLALTHQIVREHGGDIRVESEPGHGATFVLSLPVAGTSVN